MNGLRTTLVIAFILTFGVAHGQQQSKAYDLTNWGKEQKVKEMLEYWLSWEMAGPDKNIEAARERGLKQFLAMPRPKHYGQLAQSTPAWEQVAGSQEQIVSGRTTDIAFDPRPEYQDRIMYLGTAGAGVWKTTDGGEHWVPISNSFNTYAMGAVAVHPDSHDVVYAATGDHFTRNGDGIYKSTDGGMNWHLMVPASAVRTKCNQLIFNAVNHRTMYFTGGGLFRSFDGGYTWDQLPVTGEGISHLAIDPTDTNRMYFGGGGSIVRSTDGGNTWSDDLASNITNKWSATLAISKNPAKIYASIGKDDSYTVGVAVSTDYGETWTLKSSEGYMGTQAWYNNACIARSDNENTVIVGGIDLWQSTTSGSGLERISDWTNKKGTDFCHADIHMLKYSPDGRKLFAMTDGGIFMSSNHGSDWKKTLNRDLGTMLFVGADAAPDLSFYVGGTQDNGINRVAKGETGFLEVDGGDGGRTFISQDNPAYVYSTYIHVSLKRSSTYGMSFEGIIDDASELRAEGAPFYMMYDVCEGSGEYVAVCGYDNVYFSDNGAISLNKISKTKLYPQSVHVCSADPYYLYVGARNEYVYVTPDAGETWIRSTTRVGTVIGFVSDPNNTMNAWCVTTGYGKKNFWKTTDGGKVWTTPAVNVPDLSNQTIARAPNGDLFIGHAYGVMRSIDGGVNWEPLRDGIPLCDVNKLQVRNGHLVASTYGRSIYKIDAANLPRTLLSAPQVTQDPNFRITSIVPNPTTSQVELSFKLPAENKIFITLYDELGRQVRILANEFSAAGERTIRADLADLPSGTYTVVLTAAGKAVTEQLVIAR